jgi:hypothetical protein
MSVSKRLAGIELFDPDGYEAMGCPELGGDEFGVVVGRGKYAGDLVRSLPTQYLTWLLADATDENPWLGASERVRAEARRVLLRRSLRRVTPRPHGCEDMPGGPPERNAWREGKFKRDG